MEKQEFFNIAHKHGFDACYAGKSETMFVRNKSDKATQESRSTALLAEIADIPYTFLIRFSDDKGSKIKDARKSERQATLQRIRAIANAKLIDKTKKP